jgi:Zn-finger nucleic acid-binding protein
MVHSTIEMADGAQTLHCPTCGAAIDHSDATSCRYCGTRLALIACPKCFGRMFVGSKFCPHCGAPAEQPVEVGPALSCPSCNISMHQLMIKQTPLQECPRCFGLWVDAASFDRICIDRERQADLFKPGPKPRIFPASVRYRPCPACGSLMNRFNFAHTSGVIIDQCKSHGVWFDRDELQRVIDFLQAGGMEFARQRDWEEQRAAALVEQAERRVEANAQSIAAQDDQSLGGILRMIGDVLGRRMG